MSRRYYFLLASLLDLPDLGAAPPMGLGQFRLLAAEEASAAEMVDAVLLEHDLLLREAVLAGEIERAEGVVLTTEQVTGGDGLPDFLTGSGPADRQHRIAADATWEAYYHYVHRLSARRHNKFLREWTAFEVALRNALAQTRARTLGIDAHDYLVADDLAGQDEPTADIVTAWSEAPQPLAAMRVLDGYRRQWLEDHSQYFTFAVDELLAYARELVLVSRWHVLSREGEAPPLAREIRV